MHIGVWIICGFLLWSLAGFTIIYCIGICGDNFLGKAYGLEFFNPCFIYKHAYVNWFGCLFLFLLVNLICPVLSICYWVYKLCTVGRRN